MNGTYIKFTVEILLASKSVSTEGTWLIRCWRSSLPSFLKWNWIYSGYFRKVPSRVGVTL